MSDSPHDRGDDWIRRVLLEYEAPLLRYAAHLTGDVDRARDVVQDAFLKLCREERSRVEDHVAEWLFCVCRNQAMDIWRKESRLQPIEQEELDGYAEDRPSPAAVLEVKETAAQACTLLSRLPANQQEVVRLKLQEGFRYEEISRITGLSVSNVGFLLHTALKTVRRELRALSAYENRS